MEFGSLQLVQFTTEDDPQTRVGLGHKDAVRDLTGVLPYTSVLEVLDDWENAQQKIRDLDPEALEVADGATLIAPLTFPRKIFCAGANFYDHAAEMGTHTPDPELEPFFFLINPTTTVVGPDADIHVRDMESAKIDWEVELTVVIGKRGGHIAPEEAMDYVAGYTVSNDVSARGNIKRKDSIAPVFDWDWTATKGLDGFCPIGPGIVPAWEIEDENNLDMKLTVNGETKQDGNSKDMVVKIPELIAYASKISTLEPGDLILTGTPAGVGSPKGTFLSSGDEVQVSIQNIGTIVHRVWEAKN